MTKRVCAYSGNTENVFASEAVIAAVVVVVVAVVLVVVVVLLVVVAVVVVVHNTSVVSELAGSLSPVNHNGSRQGLNILQSVFYLLCTQVIKPKILKKSVATQIYIKQNIHKHHISRAQYS